MLLLTGIKDNFTTHIFTSFALIVLEAVIFMSIKTRLSIKILLVVLVAFLSLGVCLSFSNAKAETPINNQVVENLASSQTTFSAQSSNNESSNSTTERESYLDEALLKDATFIIVLGAITVVAVLSFGIFWFNLKKKH